MGRTILGTSYSTTFVGSSNHKVFGVDGSLYQGGNKAFSTKGQLMQFGKYMFSSDGIPLIGTSGSSASDMVQAISLSSALVPATTAITAYGVTYLYPSSYTNLASSDQGQLTLNAPIPGVSKTIAFDAGSTNSMLDISLTGVGIFGTSDWSTLTSTSARFIHFSSAVNGVQVINLIGLSTALWLVKSVCLQSTVAMDWGNAAGIRTSTAVRTS